ncbi:glycerol-3-phosphate cytidylyltransferase [Vibrio vulnificus]
MHKSRVIITYGTFDLFHVGHIRLLKRLYEMGDELIVGISSDKFNEMKGKKSFFSYAERAEILLACKYVTAVFPEESWEQKPHDILKYNADAFVMGDDWEGKFDFLKEYCEVIYLPRTEDISTTKIKDKLAKIKTKDLERLENSLHDVLSIVRTMVN